MPCGKDDLDVAMGFDLEKYLSSRQGAVNAELEKLLPPRREVLRRAMRYSVFAGGKRLHPVLLLAGSELASGRWRSCLPAAAAVEMVHTYSLIHDDLPCMDDDDLRRGRPTCHRRFGEATAILAGDALNTMAFGVLACMAGGGGMPARRVAVALEELARAAGPEGRVGGQGIQGISPASTTCCTEPSGNFISPTWACRVVNVPARSSSNAERSDFFFMI